MPSQGDLLSQGATGDRVARVQLALIVRDLVKAKFDLGDCPTCPFLQR